MLFLPPIRSLAVYEVSQSKLPEHRVRFAWEKACRLWSIFGFSRPRVNRSILDGGKQAANEVAYLHFVEKRVTVNLHRMESKLGLDLLPAIFAHELGHKFVPENLKNILLIDSAVKHVVEDEDAAHIVGNLFMDMLVNVDVHRRGERSISEIYSRFWKDKPDKIQQIIGRAYEKLFQRSDTSMRYAQTIIRTKPASELEAAADKIAEIITNARRSNWLKSAREFAEVLNEHAEEASSSRCYLISDLSPKNFSPDGRSPIPPQGPSDIKELQKRLGGVVYDLRQLEGDDSGKKPCSLPEFQRFLKDAHINVNDTEAKIWYYRDLIGGKSVKVPEVSVASGSLYPVTPRTWQPGDPIDRLDIPVSKSIGGVIIPGVTTKKWEMRRGQHLSIGRDYPNLDLWMDSSGSMEDPSETISHAVAAGMIVSKSFVATKKAVRVVNFSATDKFEPLFETTNGFIKDEDEIDRKIIKYFKGNTVLPLDEIEKPYATEGKQKYIVMITDLEIQNVDETTKARLRKVLKNSVGGTIFLIGEKKHALKRIFEDIGFSVELVKHYGDLEQHAFRLTKKLFESRLEI